MVALRDCNLGMAMLDWDDLRFFLAVARHRTLAVAAKHLHVTQSTVSRRLASLQEGMGVRLLQRTADGYLLTLAGESIRALSVERAVAGQDVRLDGLVRVAGAQMLTSHLLAPSYAALHGLHPGILIEALPSLPGEPLATQDADIAVRLRRFDRLGERGSIGVIGQSNPRPLGPQVDRRIHDAGHTAQSLLDPAHARRTRHPLDTDVDLCSRLRGSRLRGSPALGRDNVHCQSPDRRCSARWGLPTWEGQEAATSGPHVSVAGMSWAIEPFLTLPRWNVPSAKRPARTWSHPLQAGCGRKER